MRPVAASSTSHLLESHCHKGLSRLAFHKKHLPRHMMHNSKAPHADHDDGHTGAATTASSTQARDFVSLPRWLTACLTTWWKPEIQTSQAGSGFPFSSNPKVTSRMRGGHCKACGRQRLQAHPAILTMRSRPLIRSPAQISSPAVGQRQSRLVLHDCTHFCLPGTSLFVL